MIASLKFSSIVVTLFIFVDLLVTTFLFFKNDRISYHRNGTPFIYFDIRTSQLDHCGLSLLRSSILLGTLIGVCFNRRNGPTRLASIRIYAVWFCLTMLVYSPFKLLTLAESTTDFRSPWFWILFAWNVVSCTGCASILLFVLPNVQKRATETKRNVDAAEQLIEHRLIYGHRQFDDAKLKPEESLKRFKDQAKETTSTMWRLIKYCKFEWVWYVIGFVFLVLYSAARIFIPYFTGRVISDILVYHSYERLSYSVLIMSLLALGSSLSAGLRSGAFQYAISKMSTRSRKDLFGSLVRQEIGFFDQTKTGDITSRLASDCQAMSDTISTNVNVFLRSGIMLIGTLVFMFKLCWQMTVMTFIAIPVIALVSKVYGMYYERLSKEAQDSLAKANEVAEEVISSMRTVRSFANEVGESRRYDVKMSEVLKVRTRQTYAFIGYTWINELVDLILLIAVLWYGGHLVLTGRLLKEDLIAYLLYQLQLGEALINIGWVFTGIMQAVGASKKVFEWIDRKPEIANDGEVKTRVDGSIEFKEVTFAYPSRPDVDVLKGVTFAAKPGEVVALVGPSGGGKSSCIALLEHFYEPKSGTVALDGVAVKRFDHRFFHQRVALVGQEPVLYARSIRDNIRYGLEDDECTQEEIVHVSQLANAHRFIAALPLSYETDVGEKGVQLSGGQKQRVAIARALIRKPKVLLLDEATSALDAESEYLVQQAIHQNLAGHTVILIAHRLSTVERADKIVVIDGGRVVQEGTHASLLAQDGLYRSLVHRQLIGDRNLEKQNSLSKGERSITPLRSISIASTATSPEPPLRSMSVSPVKHFPPEE